MNTHAPAAPFRRARARRDGRWRAALGHALAASALALAGAGGVAAAPADALDALVVQARDAARQGKRPDARERLAQISATLQAEGHRLAPWAAYWDLASRLPEATVGEVDAFFIKWRGTYVEDRLRNDWLLELGKRRDLATLARELPRFRMNDDREVVCWGLLAEHQSGKDVRDAARNAWFAQRDADDGCQALAAAMVDARQFSTADVWTKVRLALEGSRLAAARAAASTMGPAFAAEVQEAIQNPARALRVGNRSPEWRTAALMRLAVADTDTAASVLAQDGSSLPTTHQAWLWAYLARQAAFKLQPQAADYIQNALAAAPRRADALHAAVWTDDALAWGLRSALRAPPQRRWPLVLGLSQWAQQPAPVSTATNPAVLAPTVPLAQRRPTWGYWRAMALRATARGAGADAERAEATKLLEQSSAELDFHGLLAAEALGREAAMPPAAAPLTAAERDAAARNLGLTRALKLIELDLRDEARREWNFTLRGMNDRELLAAARRACDAQDWQICINTADRTRGEVDLALRYPTPFRAEIGVAAERAGLDLPYVQGLIRQETRFMPQLRSSVGATGLMQVMPATGRWVARKVGLPFDRPLQQLADVQTNLQLGTSYLRLMLDDLDGSQAMAAAGYNAGPNRPRRWRELPQPIDAAAWVDSIPIQETRDYVRKVLTNAAVYEAIATGRAPALRPRLGTTIGPRASDAAPENTDLP